MFEARLDNGALFKQIIEAIKDLVTDANVDCTEDEIGIQCFNSANMSKVLKIMGKDDQIVLKAEDEGDTLIMMFENDKTGTIADFELKLMDINAEQLGVPDAPYKCTVKMPAEEFQRVVRDLQVMGDTCKISCSKEGISFSAAGTIGSGNILIRANNASDKEHENTMIDMEEPVELNFALRYLNFFTKATPLSKSVVLSMSPELPIVVEYPIEEVGYIKYYLAPKVEEEEDGED